MSMGDAICKCGHAQEAHEHYRRGSDCAICGADSCGHFRRDRNAKAAPPTDSGPQPKLVRPLPPLAEPGHTIDEPPRRRVS